MASVAVMRNRVSTEFRKVEKDGDEYLELQAQRDPTDGRPVWEETGIHDAVEQSKRLENDMARAWDVGDADQPVATIAGAASGYTSSSEVNEPLPSEREAGAEQEEGALFGLSSPPDPEVPLVSAMDDPTDTDVSGTDEAIAQQVREAKEATQNDGGDDAGSGGGKSGASGSKMRKRAAKKPSEGGAPSPTGEDTES